MESDHDSLEEDFCRFHGLHSFQSSASMSFSPSFSSRPRSCASVCNMESPRCLHVEAAICTDLAMNSSYPAVFSSILAPRAFFNTEKMYLPERLCDLLDQCLPLMMGDYDFFGSASLSRSVGIYPTMLPSHPVPLRQLDWDLKPCSRCHCSNSSHAVLQENYW